MKRYLCIGGPLDGEWATSEDMRPALVSHGPTKWFPTTEPVGTILEPAGVFGQHGNEYVDYNCASRAASRGGVHSMVRLHQSLLTPRPSKPRSP